MLDKKVIALLGKNKKNIRLIVLLQFVCLMLNVGMTFSICLIFKNIINNVVLEQRNYLLIFTLLFAEIVKFILQKVIQSQKNKLSSYIKEELRTKIIDHTFKLNNNLKDKYSLSNLVQMTLEGVEQLDLYYTVFLPQFFYGMIAPFILFIVVLTINPLIAIVLLLCIPIIPISIIMVSRFAKRIFSKYWNDYLAMGDMFLDNIKGLKELKIYNAEADYHNKMNKKAQEFKKITMKVLVMQLWSISIMDLVAFGGAALGIVLALINANNNPNNIISALFIALIAIEFFIPMRSLGSAFHISMNGRTAGRKILDFLSLEEIFWQNKQLGTIENIKLENVQFSYDRFMLSDINMTFNKNTISAIVGKSGSGKSTIIDLLMGSYYLESGNIKINDNDLLVHDKECYYKKITIVRSNTYLFNKTIRENFLIYNPLISDVQIFALLKQMQILDLILEHGGLDFVLREEATNISGGERQRIVIATCLAKNADVYIFDEATSNIDLFSEQIIVDNIYQLAKEKIVILISHRLANTIKCDNIYVLEEGKMIQEGNYSSLNSQKGIYKDLHLEQKRLENDYKKDNSI